MESSWSWTQFSLLPLQQAKSASGSMRLPSLLSFAGGSFTGLRKTRKRGVIVGQEGPCYRATNWLYRGAAATETLGTICMSNHVHFRFQHEN